MIQLRHNRRVWLFNMFVGFAFMAQQPTICSAQSTTAQTKSDIPSALLTPDTVQTPIGTLNFKNGAPTEETAQKVQDALAFTRGLNVYNNSFRGASAYAIHKGFLNIGAEDNSVVIFSELMDAKSLFLTANADTIYYLSIVDLSKGPIVIEQPPMGLGTINDMWFSWVIDIGFPGPDRGAGRQISTRTTGVTAPYPKEGISSHMQARIA